VEEVEMAPAEPTLVEQSDETQAPPSPERILQLGLAFWGSKTLLSAVEHRSPSRSSIPSATSASRKSRRLRGCSLSRSP